MTELALSEHAAYLLDSAIDGMYDPDECDLSRDEFRAAMIELLSQRLVRLAFDHDGFSLDFNPNCAVQ